MLEGSEPFATLTLDHYTQRLASAEPAPGGGSAAAVAAALGASLLTMVAGLSQDRPRYAPYASTIRRCLEHGEAARQRFLRFADEDATAYAAYAEARSLPRGSDAEEATRSERMRVAARHAAEVPLRVARECSTLASEIAALAGRSNVHTGSDLTVASLLVEAAAQAAVANVLVNLPQIEDEALSGVLTREVRDIVDAVSRVGAQTRQVVAAGSLRDPED
jgi:methenyltetrahydrofolate cyclohydrolase